MDFGDGTKVDGDGVRQDGTAGFGALETRRAAAVSKVDGAEEGGVGDPNEERRRKARGAAI